MRALLSKTYADRLLRDVGYDEKYIISASNGKFAAEKGLTCVGYYTHQNTYITVTVDRALVDLWHDSSFVLHESTKKYIMHEGMSPVELAEVDEIVIGKQHMLPVYVTELCILRSVYPKHPAHGQLKQQCSTAMQIWADAIRQPVLTGVAEHLTENAKNFWIAVRGLRRLGLLHSLAEFCLSYEAGSLGINYVPYLPMLSANAFMLNDAEEVVAFDALCSLPVFAAWSDIPLYTKREEF